jgi:hypothetical protein
MDASLSEVVVILDGAYADRLGEAIAQLQSVGLEVSSADDDHSVVQGVIDSSRLHALEALACVDYVRRVFSYDANYPPGDPRDRDGI